MGLLTDMDTYIQDLEAFSQAPLNGRIAVKPRYSPPPSPALTNRWLKYHRMEWQHPIGVDVSDEARAIAQGYSTLANAEDCTDETKNMRHILLRLAALSETFETFGSAETSKIDTVQSAIKEGTAALDIALFKRYQFLAATRCYETLPDKMADEIIMYLARMRQLATHPAP